MAHRRIRILSNTAPRVLQVIAVVLSLLAARSLASQTIETRQVMAGGGGITASAGYLVSGTISQTASGSMLLANGDLHYAGFWCGVFDARGGEAEVRSSRADVSTSRMNLWPNPASAHTTVEYLAAGAGDGELRLVDLLGNVVMRMPVDNVEAGELYRQELDLTGLPSGSYTLVLAMPGGTSSHPLMITR